MTIDKGQILERIAERAWCRTGELARELVRTPAGERETVLAELEYERWLAETCEQCRD